MVNLAKASVPPTITRSKFRQVDREESLIHLLRVNVLKRMESAVSSFTLTVHRQLKDVEATLARIEAHAEEIEEYDIADVDILVGRQGRRAAHAQSLVVADAHIAVDRHAIAAGDDDVVGAAHAQAGARILGA